MYNIPQTAFENALEENEVESETETEEKEIEIEGEDEFIPADTDEESEDQVLNNCLVFRLLVTFLLQDSESGQPEAIDLDSSFESSEGSDIEVISQNLFSFLSLFFFVGY